MVCQSGQPVGGSSMQYEFVLHQLIMVEAMGSASDKEIFLEGQIPSKKNEVWLHVFSHESWWKSDQ